MVTSTPRVTTRVAKTPVVEGRIFLPKMISTCSGRPRSRLSATSASKNARPLRGWSNTIVRETSTCRIDNSHQYPFTRSATPPPQHPPRQQARAGGGGGAGGGAEGGEKEGWVGGGPEPVADRLEP